MYDLFLSTNRDWEYLTTGKPGVEVIRPVLVSRCGEPIEVMNGVKVAPQASLADCPPVEIVCVPEITVPPGEALQERFAEELEWLRKKHRDGAILAAACSGAMLFAEAGLLDGYEATTHWAWCDEMRRRFPKISVQEHRALVVSGEGQRLIMAGGGTSWLDLALYLIARTVSVEAAMQVARVWVIDWHHVGQQPFACLARSRQAEDSLIARCQVWIAENYTEASPVTAMIQMSGLAERTFKRRFKQATGMPPLEYVHTLRLEEAKQLLESGEQPIEMVAYEVGYADTGFFNRLFKRKVNLTPAQYRRRFGAVRRSLVTQLEGAAS
ncbi:GlxA family transcriptional regulator [Microbulbifer taiwanensis]|uniref:GlxA family transcriptional regulator n=2 Tax=Microbulbifer taiwanensis TaxID=986746 RepID=A0ABW1YRE3_9GAMM